MAHQLWANTYFSGYAGADPGGAIGAIAPLKPSKVTFFTMILHKSENSIRDGRPFCRPLFGHSRDVKYRLHNLSYSKEPVMRFDYQMLLKPTPKLTGWIRPSGYVA